jgi:hypothetical protein
MQKGIVAVGLVGGPVAAGALVLLSHHPPPPPEGTIAYSAPDFRDVLVARTDGSGQRRSPLLRGHSSTPASRPTAA